MHKLFLTAAVLGLCTATTASSAFAEWGCAYDSSAGVGRMWNVPTEKEAREITLHACKTRNFKNCRLIGCSANVNSKEDADKIWARTPGVKYEPCGGEGQQKC
jgi:hypothetical protein